MGFFCLFGDLAPSKLKPDLDNEGFCALKRLITLATDGNQNRIYILLGKIMYLQLHIWIPRSVSQIQLSRLDWCRLLLVIPSSYDFMVKDEITVSRRHVTISWPVQFLNLGFQVEGLELVKLTTTQSWMPQLCRMSTHDAAFPQFDASLSVFPFCISDPNSGFIFLQYFNGSET